MRDNSGSPSDAFADWRVKQRPMLFDNAVLATQRGAPINDVARGVVREHGMTIVWIERASSPIGAESRGLELLGGTTLAT